MSVLRRLSKLGFTSMKMILVFSLSTVDEIFWYSELCLPTAVAVFYTLLLPLQRGTTGLI